MRGLDAGKRAARKGTEGEDEEGREFAERAHARAKWSPTAATLGSSSSFLNDAAAATAAAAAAFHYLPYENRARILTAVSQRGARRARINEWKESQSPRARAAALALRSR
jgi:hypothetical protein